MGLQGKAALVGVAQYKPEKYATAPRMFHLEQVADLTLQALEDAGILGGLPVEDGILWCATERNTKAQIDQLVAILKKAVAA